MTQMSYEAYVNICKVLKDLAENKGSVDGRIIRETEQIQIVAHDASEALALLKDRVEGSRTVTVKRDKHDRIHITDERSPYAGSVFPHEESFIRWARAEGYWRAMISDANEHGTFYPGRVANWPD